MNPSFACDDVYSASGLTRTDAFPPLLWLWHNKVNGRLFFSKRQMVFTVLNFSIVLLGMAIVSDFSPYWSRRLG